MRVRDKMTPDPVSITPQTTIAGALSLMREGDFRRLPVIDRGKLVGIVTDRDLSEVSPSPATSLSIFELNYLLSCTKSIPLSEAEVIFIIRCLPGELLDDGDNEIGAIGSRKREAGSLRKRIFEAFIDLIGLRDPGTPNWNWSWR